MLSCVGLTLENGAVDNEEMSKRSSCNDRGWDDNVKRHCWSNKRKEWSKEFRFASVGFQHAYEAGPVSWSCCLRSELKGELVVPEAKPAAGLVLPFQQRMRVILPLVSAAFKIPARPVNVAVPARRVMKTWQRHWVELRFLCSAGGRAVTVFF